MNYKMEELVPIVGKLAEKYTAFESTSISYEKAEQLMGAVLYCIRETYRPEDTDSGQGTGIAAKENRLSAQQAYETGVGLAEKKAKASLALYHKILPGFDSYGNQCLRDTFLSGLPAFFQWYDVKFEPQNTILTLDYPVLRDISKYTGVDKIYEFLQCIHLEQIFLNKFPKQYVKKILMKNSGQYEEMADNICEVVFMAVAGHILARKPLQEWNFEEKDYLRIQEIFQKNSFSHISGLLKGEVKELAGKYYGEKCYWENGAEPEELAVSLSAYLEGAAEGILIRLKNGAENGVLEGMI